MVIETDKNINLFEFKFNVDKLEAINQIENREYYQKYINLNKPIALIGVSFMKSKNKFDIEWIAKKLD